MWLRMDWSGLRGMVRGVEDRLRVASRRLMSGRDNLNRGDFETAVNRAYYAAFEAAHAALAALEVAAPQTHRGLVGQFGLHCVRAGLINKDVASHLGELGTARLIADYEGDVPDADAARTAVHMAEQFVASIHDRVLPRADIGATVDGVGEAESLGKRPR